MFGELIVQLSNELQFVELSEVCSVNKQFAQLRMGFTNVSYWANIICSVLKVKLFRHVEDIIIITNSALSPFLTGRMFVRPNILRTLRRTMIRFLIELLVRRIWFGQSKLYFILNWLVMRCKLQPELAADALQTAWSKMRAKVNIL